MTLNHLAVTTTEADAAGAGAARHTGRVAVELPTLLIALVTYGGWLAITFAYGHWPLAIVAPIAAVLITLHGSLQHEIVHGHPTRWDGVNRLIAIVPLSLWLPFERYRQSHRAHHIDERITDPLDDPESYYWTPQDWARLKPVTRVIVQLQQTIGRFLSAESRAVIRNQDGVRAVWLEHLLWCIPVIVWVKIVCGMPLSIYVLAMAIPGTSLTLIRSFAEHRARPQVRARIAIVEGSWILGPLYLFNNLHALHHEAPAIPWYEYPARYRLNRERLIAENGGLVYRTYFDVARRFLFRPHDTPRHPSGRVPVLPA